MPTPPPPLPAQFSLMWLTWQCGERGHSRTAEFSPLPGQTHLPFTLCRGSPVPQHLLHRPSDGFPHPDSHLLGSMSESPEVGLPAFPSSKSGFLHLSFLPSNSHDVLREQKYTGLIFVKQTFCLINGLKAGDTLC